MHGSSQPIAHGGTGGHYCIGDMHYLQLSFKRLGTWNIFNWLCTSVLFVVNVQILVHIYHFLTLSNAKIFIIFKRDKMLGENLILE